ncbi:MAG: thrombospondin type 3 repeat-containing protein [Gammaproteobacteria bacterium]|nr:thrombospondin type 3 repeat-containing protein [Gammaproteobacteria bacterium]
MDNTTALKAAVIATVGAAAAPAAADVYTAVLTDVRLYSNGAPAGQAGNITSSTATWSYDTVTNQVTQTGGTFNIRFTTAPTSTLYRTSITGLVMGNAGAASASTYVCTEGNFGGGVGASICGNYSFGGNFLNESTTTWGPGTAVSRTIGGDDIAIGNPQGIANLNGMTTSSFSPPALVLTNGTCTGPCATLPAGSFNGGMRWSFGNLTLATPGATDDALTAEAGIANTLNVLQNDVGYSDPVTVTIETPPSQGGTAVVTAGTSPAVVRVQYTPAPGFLGTETFTYRAVSGALDDTATVSVNVIDTIPNAFSFPSQPGVPMSTLVTSAATTITGLSTASPISVANGQYSIGCTATFTAAAATISNGQTVCVRHTSAASTGTDTVTTLTIGGVAGTFTSTTVPPDTVADPFAFVDQSGVALGVAATSAPVTITGINQPAPVTVTNGSYSINGGAFTTVAGAVTNGQSIRVRHTSSPAPDTAVDTLLDVGGVTDTFTSTTVQYAIDDTAVTATNQPVQIPVLANDVNLAASVYVDIWSPPAHGTAEVSGAPGAPAGISITYTPDPGYTGPDAFDYWVETGVLVDYARVNITVSATDSDGDGVADVADNCTQLANSSQCDSDGDGYGNRCDADLTNNGVTNAQDTVLYRAELGAPSVGPAFNAADLNCSGAVNAQDTVLFRQLLGLPPGPSGQAP